MQIKRIGILISLFLLSFIHFLEAQNHTVIRAAIDIGMGGPKLQIAEVDIQTQKIVKPLFTERYFVNFYEGISKSADNRSSCSIFH
jgi:hypothetical protein